MKLNSWIDSHWIWPEMITWDLVNSYALFRKRFEIKRIPRKAIFYITADQSYQLYLNGHFIARGPGRGFQVSWDLDEHRVEKFLKKGSNIIAVRAYHPGTSNFQYRTEGVAGLLGVLDLGKQIIKTDAQWKCRRQTGIHRGTVPSSVQMFAQEHIDLREEDPHWFDLDFDDSTWKFPETVLAYGTMPWHQLQKRSIPPLDEKKIVVGEIIAQSEGVSLNQSFDVSDVVHERLKDPIIFIKRPPTALQVQIQSKDPSHYQSYLIDLGKTHVGSPCIEIQGANGNEIIDSIYVERIEAVSKEDLRPIIYQPAMSSVSLGNRMICRRGDQEHVFYHPYGFRYWVITVKNMTTPLQLKWSLRTVLYPLQIQAQFKTSEEPFQKIWEASVWTQRCCSLDAYVDTPWREQAQWWGDARVQAWNTFYLSGDLRLLRRGIDQIAFQKTPDGITYGHAPTIAHHCILPDFSLIWIMTLWDDYWQSGSVEKFVEHQETVHSILNYFEKRLHSKTGMTSYDSRFWLFLDWAPIHREGCPTLLNLWWLMALEAAIRMGGVAKQKNGVSQWKKRASELRKSLRRLKNAEGLLWDGYDKKGKVVRHASVQCQTLAIALKLNGFDEKTLLEKRLLAWIRGEWQTTVAPSAYWVTYIFHELIQRGFAKEVLDQYETHWLPMAEHGTTWENFKPKEGGESFSHAWSAHGVYHLMQILGGVMPIAPAWKEVLIQPNFLGDHAKIVYPTPHGKMISEWKKVKGCIQGSVTLPKGIRAKIGFNGKISSWFTGKKNYQLKNK